MPPQTDAERRAELLEAWERVDLTFKHARSAIVESERLQLAAMRWQADLLKRFGPRPEKGVEKC